MPLNESGRRVLVTGGSGFVGSNLIASLVARGDVVLNLDVVPPSVQDQHRWWRRSDVMDPQGIGVDVAAFSPTEIIHLAAKTAVRPGLGVDDYRVNLLGSQYILNSAADAGSVRRLLMVSTQFVCRPGYVPRGDDDYDPHTPYGESKVLMEQMIRESETGLSWVILRPTTIWGPGDLRYRRAFYRTVKSGLYLHPAHRPCARSLGYVGNLVHQVESLIDANDGLVGGRTFYGGDPPINLIEFADAFSIAITGHEVRVVNAALVKGAAVVGDLLRLLRVPFPITSPRYRSMTEDYYASLEPMLDLAGPSVYSLNEGVAITVRWLRSIGMV